MGDSVELECWLKCAHHRHWTWTQGLQAFLVRSYQNVFIQLHVDVHFRDSFCINMWFVASCSCSAASLSDGWVTIWNQGYYDYKVTRGDFCVYMGLSVISFCSKRIHFICTYSCCSNHGQSGLLLHQLVPVQDWLGEIPPREYRTFSLHPPGVCIRCHRPRIWDHWIWAQWEKSLQIIYGAEKKVKSGASGCALLSCWTVTCFTSFSCFLCNRNPMLKTLLSVRVDSEESRWAFPLLFPNETLPSADRQQEWQQSHMSYCCDFFSEKSYSGNTELLHLAISIA